MTTVLRRYLVMGAGALGSVFGGLLQHRGQSVAFIGRGDHFGRITTRGLTIEGIWGEFQVGPVVPHPVSAGGYDVILLCVKSFHTREACRRVKGLLAPRGSSFRCKTAWEIWRLSPRSSARNAPSGPG